MIRINKRLTVGALAPLFRGLGLRLRRSRASGDDHESHRRAIEQARERLSQCQSRIADYARQGEG